MNEEQSQNSEKESTTVLVTGATGFLGKNVLMALSSDSSLKVIAACRNKSKLPAEFNGELRIGDLTDRDYRENVVKGIDVICHLGTWSSFWGHAKKEKTDFYEPCVDLIEQAIEAGVKRFFLASTVAVGQLNKDGKAIDDFSPTVKTGFWPHLDYLIEIDNYMKANANRGMQMTNMRLGHFVGKGNTLGLVPAIVPRFRTYLVPWLAGGKKRMAVTADEDLTHGFVCAVKAKKLDNYESFNICGVEFPRLREVFTYIAEQSNSPKPWYSVPYFAGYIFGWLMETLFPIMPGSSPFLTRSLVHVSEDWYCPSEYATRKIGYIPNKSWKVAIDESLNELKKDGFQWPKLAQT